VTPEIKVMTPKERAMKNTTVLKTAATTRQAALSASNDKRIESECDYFANVFFNGC